jgi:hypothetical protein
MDLGRVGMIAEPGSRECENWDVTCKNNLNLDAGYMDS